MLFTKKDELAKEQLIKLLNKQGYHPYALLLSLFDIKCVDDANTIAYMVPQKAIIAINENLFEEQLSTFIRHEILHEFYTHFERMEQHVGKDDWDKRTSQMQQASNMAGDWEISNRAYTDADKKIAKNIKLRNKDGSVSTGMQGLVTDIDRPDWTTWSLEQMYDALMDEMKNEPESNDDDNASSNGGGYSDEYIAGWEQAMKDYENGLLDLGGLTNG